MTYYLSVNLIHNSSFTVFTENEILEVIELERFTNVKNHGVFWGSNHLRKEIVYSLLKYLKNKYSVLHYDTLFLNQLDLWNIKDKWDIKQDNEILEFFNSNKFEFCDHQYSHACGAFYQSNLDNAIVISFDGGGNDGNFNIYSASKENGVVLKDKIFSHVLGHRYGWFGHNCSSIKKEISWPLDGALIYPGKLMGLSGFGNVINELIPDFEEYYTDYPDGLESKYYILKEKYKWPDVLEGQLEKDIIATSQYVFEKKFNELTYKYWKDEKNLILTGGCAYNIINNDNLKQKINVFVPPNPGDGGLSLGQALSFIKNPKYKETAFLGPEVWDKDIIMDYIIEHNGEKYTPKLIVDELLQGKIIGVVKGKSELGPRALGNRSIICYAGYPEMKDILNYKVKNREPYRPFAPVCLESQADMFFELNGGNYSYMNFCPKVKEEYKDKLKSITHIDGTARLQTIDSTSTLYPFIEEINRNENALPVLLNTSFNVGGKPILNTYRDAIWMLNNTQMDGLILEDYYIKKRQNG